MKPTSGTTLSVWAATTTEARVSPLAENASAHVCIIGAGIAGLTTAYLLAKNRRITETEVIDARTLPEVKMPARARYVPDDRLQTNKAR